MIDWEMITKAENDKKQTRLLNWCDNEQLTR
jgi:hypothetical protein